MSVFMFSFNNMKPKTSNYSGDSIEPSSKKKEDKYILTEDLRINRLAKETYNLK